MENSFKYARLYYDGEKIYALINSDNTFQRIIPSYFSEKFEISKKRIKLTEEIKILPPCEPTKIICLGLNYKDHAKELKMPLPKHPIIFIKPSSAVIGHRDNIIYPKGVRQLDYEAELAVVIKKLAKSIPKERVKEYILGYTCFNDVTARDLQRKDIQWTRAKSFDTFAPIGPWIVTNINIENLKIQTFLNGKVVQNSNTKNMIFKIEEVVSFISNIMTLYPQDVISLGTPPGVGPMKRGDSICVKIEKIGELINFVV